MAQNYMRNIPLRSGNTKYETNMEPTIESRIKRQRKFRAVKKQQVGMLKAFYEFIKEKDISLVKEFLKVTDNQAACLRKHYPEKNSKIRYI